jgi:hypothetical protein
VTGIDLQIHVLRVCSRQLEKLSTSGRLSVLKMLTETTVEDGQKPEPLGQTVIPGALEASKTRG